LPDDVKRLFALSEEARSQGIGSDPKVKNQLELSRAIVVGQAYIKQQQKEKPGPAPLSDIRPERSMGTLSSRVKNKQFNDFPENSAGKSATAAGGNQGRAKG